MSDIRKWFMKKHDKDNGIATKPGSSTKSPSESVQTAKSEQEQGDHESAGRKKTSKYFSSDNKKEKDEKKVDEVIGKRKFQTGSSEMHSDAKPPPRKKVHKIEEDDDDDFVETAPRRADVTPNKKLKSGTGRGIVKKSMDVDGSDEEDYSAEPKSRSKSTGSGRGRAAAKAPVSGKGMVVDESDGDDDPDIKDIKSSKSAGRGRGGRASTTAAPSGGRGRGGGGRGGYMNFADRKDPPHKGEKEIPEGSPDCLANLTFVISGTLDSLEREEAEDLIKRHGGRVTGSVSKKTNYLLCDEDIGGRKSAKAKELGTGMLTEDGLFDMIRRSKKTKSPKLEESPKPVGKVLPSPSKMSTTTPEKRNQASNLSVKGSPTQRTKAGASPLKPKTQSTVGPSLSWPEKYRPKTSNDIIGNQSLVKQLHDWLQSWSAQFMGTGSKSKGKKPNDAGAKKAVLLSGTPGIGKTTAARLVSQMLGFNTIEVNASDSRGKANTQIGKGIGGSTANTMKELINNEALSKRNMDRSQHPKTVLIMDEVDGMSAGDRGGVADLISSIKISKIPIICICNDRYSQKLKSLVNYCLMLNFRKPTKQQMAKRLLHIASAEGIKVNEIALEELAERVNGDMRLAVNQLQYMSLSMSVIKYDDIRQRLQTSSKDEDISPFTAVDKLFGFNSGKLRMDERIDLSLSDPDLVPLLIQENYINYKPSAAAKDDSGVKRMALLARAAESIADGDIINVQIRRYRQWQLFQSSSVASSIIPASLLHGQRETLEQGERNFNRFGGWLGKNSTMRKNYRILEDLHVHILASRESYLGRTTLRLDYCTLLLKQMTDTLRVLPKDEAVDKVVEFMDTYSISQEDFDTIIEVSKFQGHPSAMEGIPPAVKAALTKAYKNGSSSRVIRTADMITLPGIKKPVKKRVAAMLEPEEGSLGEDNGDAVEENVEDNNSSDSEDESSKQKKLTADLQSLNSKSVQVQMELKGVGSSSGVKKASGRGKGSSSQAGEKKEGGGRGRGGGGGGGGGRGGGRGGSPAAASTSKRKR